MIEQTRLERLHDNLAFLNNALLVPLFTLMLVGVMEGSGRELLVTLDLANLGFCALFFAEWLLGLAIAEDRVRYLMSVEKLLDLLSSIPFGHIFQGVRLARLVRIIRIVRVILRARRYRGAGRRLVRVATIVGSTVFAGAVGLRTVEPETVSTLGDAFWWSLITVSTVGYGDIVPSTRVGQIVAGMLVLFGIGVFGYIAGFMTSLMDDEEEDEILETVKRLEKQLAGISATLNER